MAWSTDRGPRKTNQRRLGSGNADNRSTVRALLSARAPVLGSQSTGQGKMVQEPRARFHVARWGVFYHSERLQISPACFKQVLSDRASRHVIFLSPRIRSLIALRLTITANRMISGEVLKYLKGEHVVIYQNRDQPRNRQVYLTTPLDVPFTGVQVCLTTPILSLQRSQPRGLCLRLQCKFHNLETMRLRHRGFGAIVHIIDQLFKIRQWRLRCIDMFTTIPVH